MTVRRITIAVAFLAFSCSLERTADGAGGTSIVATKGQATHVSSGWPDGVGELVNDESRTTGWNSWFTEWPNDVNQYAFEIKSIEDLNRLVQKLAAVKADLRGIRLSYLKEPGSLGWVTQIPEGNGIPAIFSIGDQSQIDEWFKRVRKPFGVMEFTATPVAVPPTLTLFVRNDQIDLSKLQIPDGIDLSLGHIPMTFHKSNTTREQEREKEAKARTVSGEDAAFKKRLDESSLAAVHEIEKFIDSQLRSRFRKEEAH